MSYIWVVEANRFGACVEQRGVAYVSADAQDPMGIVHHIAEVDKDLPPGLLRDAPFDFNLCTEVMEHVALGIRRSPTLPPC
jgi:hypothetical protein